MQHLLTVDVEQTHRGIHGAPAQGLGADAMRAALMRWLKFLEDQNILATFFVLADDLSPVRSLLRQALANGHEIGCHGLHHERIDLQDPRQFPIQVREARERIQDDTGSTCLGFRAPWFSRPDDPSRFFDALLAAGFEYDASGRSPLHGPPPSFSSPISLIDTPLTGRGLFSLAVLGGLALRVLPRFLIKALVRQCERADRPACLFLHPYEWHRMNLPGGLSPMQRRRRRWGVDKTLPRLHWLFAQSDWTSIERARSSRAAPHARLTPSTE